jgi:hypothetical protein
VIYYHGMCRRAEPKLSDLDEPGLFRICEAEYIQNSPKYVSTMGD